MPSKKSCRLERGPAMAIAAFALLFLVGEAQAYTYNNLGAVGGWDNVLKTSTVSYVLDRSDYPTYLTEPNVTGALKNAFGTWSAAPKCSLAFAEKPDNGGNYDLLDGPGDGPPWYGGYPGDSADWNANYLYANITHGGWLANDYFDYLEDGKIDGVTSGILAVCWTGTVKGPLNRKPSWIANIFFNSGWAWSLSGDDPTTANTEIDIQAVMLHELGHAIGLGHSDVAGAVMGPYYDPDNPDRVLSPDDQAGVASLYPTRGGRKPTPGGQGNHISLLDLQDYNALLQGSAPIPEPGTLILLASGWVALAIRRRSRR